MLARLTPLTLALAIAAFVAAPASAEPAPTTLDSLGASADPFGISVTGSATFGSQDPVEVGFDGTGDSAISAGVGLDLEKFTIQRTSGTSNNLTFVMDLDGLTGGGVPEGFQYNWDIAVDGGADQGGSNWSIKTMRSGQGSNPGQLNGWAALYSCVPDPDSPTGGFNCSPLAPLNVVYDEAAGAIRMTVPMNRIDAQSGSTIEGWARNGQPIWVRTSAAGALTGFVNVDDHFPDVVYTVPGNTVQIGIAPAGTPEQFVTYTDTANVSGGNFAGMIPTPAPGAYDVWAKACFGGDNCDAASTPITV